MCKIGRNILSDFFILIFPFLCLFVVVYCNIALQSVITCNAILHCITISDFIELLCSKLQYVKACCNVI